MPALLLDVVQLLAGGDQLACVAVSEIVDSDLADLRYNTERFPDPCPEVVTVHGRDPIAEHVAIEDIAAVLGKLGFGVHRQPNHGTAHAVESGFECGDE